LNCVCGCLPWIYRLMSALWPPQFRHRQGEEIARTFDAKRSVETMRTLIYACWIVFLGFWLAAALRTKSTVERASWRDRLSYRLPIMLSIALLITSSRIPVLETQVLA